MLLAIDIGNTNINFGVYEKKSLLLSFKISSLDFAYDNIKSIFDERLSKYAIRECIISSVVDELTGTVIDTFNKLLNVEPKIITSNSNFEDMGIKVEVPKEVGADRLVNAYGAKKLYNYPLIVIDIGSATTFDIVDANGDFIGGIIMPGIGLQIKSLAKNTSKLPIVKIGTTTRTIGDNTENSILSGVIRGTANAIDGLIKECENELQDKPKIIITGGDADRISEYLKYPFDTINKNLTLDSLCMLNDIN